MSNATDHACRTVERDKLLTRYRSCIHCNPQMDRRLVSFQGNRRTPFFGWFKYKEGFSADLVKFVLGEFSKRRGVLLDPFAGVGTSLVVSRALGWDSIGVELLPVGLFSTEARLAAEAVKAATFKRYFNKVADLDWRHEFDSKYALEHIPITRGAFPKATEKAIAGYRAFCDREIRNVHVRNLFYLAGMAVLESVSYTRKDGQYLRWDYRAGKTNGRSRFDKGVIADFNSAIRTKLGEIHRDLARDPRIDRVFFEGPHEHSRMLGTVDLRQGSSLDILPQLADDSVDLILTSPPYCNRYDYTRTYALELVYLGFDADGVAKLRQSMLSCTVENRAKVDEMRRSYQCRSEDGAFQEVCSAFARHSALHEVLEWLDEEGRHGRLNNVNIPRMVRNYFFEMCFVVYEMARILRPGGRVVMVNDNVRYAGEEVPVDLILSDFGKRFGLSIEHIWTLPRGKGNSSQQMGAHGRSELRKCIYIWHKL